MSFPYNRLLNLPVDTGFFTSTSTMSDYYILKEKFEGLEEQTERLEQVTSSRFSRYYVNSRSFDLQLDILKDTLKFIRSLVQEYARGFLIETNFTPRLAQCEQRVDAIVLKVQKVLNRNHVT